MFALIILPWTERWTMQNFQMTHGWLTIWHALTLWGHKMHVLFFLWSTLSLPTMENLVCRRWGEMWLNGPSRTLTTYETLVYALQINGMEYMNGFLEIGENVYKLGTECSWLNSFILICLIFFTEIWSLCLGATKLILCLKVTPRITNLGNIIRSSMDMGFFVGDDTMSCTLA